MSKYRNPAAMRAALWHHLKRQTSGTGRSFNRALNILLMERFLARVLHVVPERAVILKGGLALELRLSQARTTKDIDLRYSGDARQVPLILQRAGRVDLGDFLAYEVEERKRSSKITGLGVQYQGQRYKATATMGGSKVSEFTIDVAMGDPVTGPVHMVGGSRTLEFAGIETPVFPIYPIETHIAEKLHAYTLPRADENGRVKDLPDLALLGGADPLQASDMRAAIEATFRYRASHAIPAKLPPPPPSWNRLYAKLAADNSLVWRTLADVFAAAADFIDPILNPSTKPASWDPTARVWAKTISDK